ncbi:MAG: NAD-dependent malic enzyme [Deltaproteobacteria bacterium]|nr:NAD-dependent malic enzyme [Deltaproteobacteria bacterium]
MKHELAGRVIKRARLKFVRTPCHLGKFATMVASFGGAFGEIRSVSAGKNFKIRDVDIHAPSDRTFDDICERVRGMEGVDLIGVTDVVQEVHEGGKIRVAARTPVESVDDLGLIYTPGVAAICRQIRDEPELAHRFTTIPNTVAIVTNGTAILGLGDIGPVAGMPVMEGKALLFQLLAGIDGVPILIDSHDPDQIVRTVEGIAPTFGAIKLEDIKAPECFEIESRLDAALDIPVVHDDQHGTAVVVLAALLNIAEYTYIDLKKSSVGIIGLGAAGTGIFKLLRAFGVKEIYGTDIDEPALERFGAAGGKPTDLAGVLAQSKVVIATTGVPGLIKPAAVQPKQVILALSNPDPEIEPDEAIEAGAAFAADGKGVNNALAFPGLFRGALTARATRVNNAMKIAAATAIARFAEGTELVPDILRKEVHEAVAAAVAQAAYRTGVVKHEPDVEG